MKAFVIHLPTAPKKAIPVDHIVAQLTQFGIDAVAFAGTDGARARDLIEQNNLQLWPYNVKGQKIDHTDRDWNKLSRLGVAGCFLSHYTLWQRCVELNEPIMIFEDDVKLYRGWNPVEWNDILILSLGKKSAQRNPWKRYLENPADTPEAKKWTNRSMPGTSGYAIRPAAAQRLIETYQGYWTASDNAINCDICQLQISNYIMGRDMSAQEGNVSLTKRSWA
mgnify:CR=1 FL=1